MMMNTTNIEKTKTRAMNEIKEIRSYDDVSELIRAEFTDWKIYGNVNALYYDSLVLFNYTFEATKNNFWNFFERMSRGAVFNAKTGELIARAFLKFYNYGERIPYQNTSIVEATEKLDGSMIVIWWYNDQWNCSTRGSFTIDQALWAKKQLDSGKFDVSKLDTDYTYLCEAVYPENRIVVDYAGRSELFLIGCIDKKFGRDLYWGELEVIANEVGFSLPKHYTLNTIEDYLGLASELSVNEEGYVVRYNDGQRFKVKGGAYLVAHRLVSGISKRRVAEALQAGILNAMIDTAPEEFTVTVRQWRDELLDQYKGIHLSLLYHFDVAPKATKKDFALYVQRECPGIATFMFKRLSNQEYVPLIWKYIIDSIKEEKNV